MREIKFRAWDGKSMWFPCNENDLMILIGDSGYFEVQDHGQGNKAVDIFNSSDNNNTALMQYTGLKDKNGKEIYEGDIVTTHFPKTNQYEAYTEKGVVVNHWNSFIPTLIEDKAHGKNNNVYSHSEVIGNIYETQT